MKTKLTKLTTWQNEPIRLKVEIDTARGTGERISYDYEPINYRRLKLARTFEPEKYGYTFVVSREFT